MKKRYLVQIVVTEQFSSSDEKHWLTQAGTRRGIIETHLLDVANTPEEINNIVADVISDHAEKSVQRKF